MHPLDLAKRIALIISHEEMDDIIEVVRSLKDAGLLIKCVSQTIINEAKEQNGGFPGMLLGILVSNLLGNLLTGKGAKAKKSRKEANRAGEGAITAGQNF